MILDDILEKIKDAQCPASFSNDLNIGTYYIDDKSQKLFEFFQVIYAPHLQTFDNTKKTRVLQYTRMA